MNVLGYLEEVLLLFKWGIYGVKYICNGVNLYVIVVGLINGPHVQCVNKYIQILCSHY
jgi:hypothetical protein